MTVRCAIPGISKSRSGRQAANKAVANAVKLRICLGKHSARMLSPANEWATGDAMISVTVQKKHHTSFFPFAGKKICVYL